MRVVALQLEPEPFVATPAGRGRVLGTLGALLDGSLWRAVLPL
jgi:hypothetical protein